MSPLVRSADGSTLTATIRDYAGEIREGVAHTDWWRYSGYTIVDIPICESGIPDTVCSWRAPDWIAKASVDGGATWLDEDYPPVPVDAVAMLIADTTPIPMLEWRGFCIRPTGWLPTPTNLGW